MGVGRLLQLWNKWGMQILVLASFLLQVFLLVFGGIRRRSSSAVLRVALWLAYLLADSTAIYTLGHLSVASGSREHQLVAFWAPFLLLHLGGPDNITAYALEDNRLWLRHLQTLIVQVLGAAYVVYKYIGSSSDSFLLLLASVSMFVAGGIKYGERIWALKCGNMSSFTSKAEDGVDPCQLLSQGMGEEEILLRAHSQFDICKCVFTDMKLQLVPEPSSSDKDGFAGPDESARPAAYTDEDVYKLVEMELSLMYDVLYTKASVIHKWYGLCIHFISLLGAATAFLLFQLSSRTGYNGVDVIMSYALLVGALVLEALSVSRALLSTWTCSFLYRRGSGWHWLLHLVISLRRRLKPASRRLWSGSIGQYNLFHLCTRDRDEVTSRLATKIGLRDWWNKLHFSGTFSGTDSFSVQDLKEEVLKQVLRTLTSLIDMGTELNLKNTFISELLGISEIFHWSADIDFDESILVLHIATDVYIRESRGTRDDKLIEVIKVLSNYMMFLLVVKPEMLPGRPRHNVYLDACKYLDGCWNQYKDDDDDSVTASPRCCNSYCILKELFHHEGPNGSRIQLREKLMEKLFSKYKDEQGSEAPEPHRKWSSESIGKYGFLLAKEILDRESRGEFDNGDTLVEILEVWVEMMLYAADHCSRDSHARQLSNGGEFITIVWLLAQHHIYLSRHLNRSVSTRSSSQVETEDLPRISDAETSNEDGPRNPGGVEVDDSSGASVATSEEDGPRTRQRC